MAKFNQKAYDSARQKVFGLNNPVPVKKKKVKKKMKQDPNSPWNYAKALKKAGPSSGIGVGP